jgi:hypothetical protein
VKPRFFSSCLVFVAVGRVLQRKARHLRHAGLLGLQGPHGLHAQPTGLNTIKLFTGNTNADDWFGLVCFANKNKIVTFHTTDSKPVKQEVSGTVILPPLVFPAVTYKC